MRIFQKFKHLTRLNKAADMIKASLLLPKTKQCSILRGDVEFAVRRGQTVVNRRGVEFPLVQDFAIVF